MRRRLLEIIPVLQVGGAERQLLLKSELLSQAGYEIAIVPLRGGGGLEHFVAEKVEILAPPIDGARPASIWETASHVLGAIRNTNPDVVVGHLTAGAVAARMTSVLKHAGKRAKVVEVWHGDATRHLVRQLFLRRSTNIPDASVTVSEVLADALAAKGMVQPARTTTIRNAVTGGRLEPRSRARRQDSKLRVLAIGRLVPSKNIEVIIRAMSGTHKAVELTIVGDGPERDGLERLTSQLGLSDRIGFVGSRKNVDSFYAESDVLAHPSTAEGFGLAPVEAHLRGLNLVLANLPVYRELFRTDAYLVADPHNPDEWRQAFEQMRFQSAHAGRFGGNRLRFDPSPTRMSQEWDGLLNAVLWA